MSSPPTGPKVIANKITDLCGVIYPDSSAQMKRVKKRRPDWSIKLTRPLTLKNGDKIITLADARATVVRYFKPVTESRSVVLAIERLLKAAKTGTFTDRKAATDQVEKVLRARY